MLYMEISVKTSKKEELLDITSRVSELVNLESGLCIVYCPHPTAGLTINEGADPDVRVDIIAALGRLVPDNVSYKHVEGNSPAHIKASLIGNSLNVLVEDGELKLGTWQSIYLCEFDGPRNRKVFVKFIKF